MKRLLALAAAAAMIVGALYARGEIGGDGGGLALDSPERHVICVPELEAACDALAAQGVKVTVEEAGETAAKLADAETPPADAWLTLQPWPAMVEEARQRAVLEPIVAGEPVAVARSPLVMTAWGERSAVLERRCRNGVSWGCVGKQAAKRWDEIGGETGWGQMKLGFRDPNLTASGLLVLGQATSDFLGTSDFSTRDFERPDFATWLGDVKHAVPSTGTAAATPLTQLLQRGRAVYDFVGTTEAEAGTAIARAAPDRRRGLVLQYPETAAVADAVLAPLHPEAQARLGDLVAEHGGQALSEAGWRVEGRPLVDGLDAEVTLPAQSGVPSAGALEALRVRWEEITR